MQVRRAFNFVKGRPHCYNRDTYPAGSWQPNGPGRLRWVRNRMSRECMSHAVPPGSQSVPEREAWACEGCRHWSTAPTGQPCAGCGAILTAAERFYLQTTCSRCEAGG